MRYLAVGMLALALQPKVPAWDAIVAWAAADALE